MKNLKLKKGPDMYPNTNWVVGTYEYRTVLYKFNAKIYSEPSVYGIKEGRVSKLWVRNEQNNKVVFHYERGYDIGDESQTERGMLKDLLGFLENYAVEAWQTFEN